MNRGFSLVELSIVLVILGLLTGGILAGQSLIRAAELRAVSTEAQRYQTAFHSFRDRYFAIPGDFRDATKFWQRYSSAGAVACATNSSASVSAANGACDGNGSGALAGAASGGQAAEFVQTWRHLTLAGLIEGSFTGITGAAGGDHTVPGTNIPQSKLANAAWSSQTVGVADPPTWGGYWWAKDYGSAVLILGAQSATGWPWNAVIKPEEAWNIDTKMDDGMPATGRVISGQRNSCSTDASVAGTTFSATYALTSNAIACGLLFTNAW